MNDNLTRYFAIQKALKQLWATAPKGNVARHLNTLACKEASGNKSSSHHLCLYHLCLGVVFLSLCKEKIGTEALM